MPGVYPGCGGDSGKNDIMKPGMANGHTEAGVYLLFDRDSGNIVCIGQSANCAKRLMSHVIKFPDEKISCFLS